MQKKHYDGKGLISMRVSDAMGRKTNENDYNAAEEDTKRERMVL